MLRSLVGSEMCIRDRSKKLPGIMIEQELQRVREDLCSQTTDSNGNMVGARGENAETASLEKFALAGRPMRIEVELVERIRALGSERLGQDARKLVADSVVRALDVLACTDPLEFGRTASLCCSDGEMWVNKLERTLLKLLEVLDGAAVRTAAIPIPAAVAVEPMPEHVATLCDFGFEAVCAQFALVQTNNDVNKSLDLLLGTSREELQELIDAHNASKIADTEPATAEDHVEGVEAVEAVEGVEASPAEGLNAVEAFMAKVLADPEIKQLYDSSPKIQAAWADVSANPMNCLTYTTDPDMSPIVQRIMTEANQLPGGLMGLVASLAPPQAPPSAP
eukprot:TRINITY_DN2106_c0_g2_i2.p1 TRINITY_DN2106_c0_g2~~TRINITY_DN2106_c0_g2_i2.p1  ORF type:complete len:336 (-),score=106.30 TRINITY_DN2106_c0_g2_i2:315-1322(-)